MHSVKCSHRHLPGRVIAQITTNVYDTVTGAYLLIPQGSRLIGAYDSVIAFGQERALVVWQRIIMPDGSSVVIENLPATDAAGCAGLADKVDFHTWRLLKGIALSTLLSVGTELTLGEDEGDLVKAIRESAQDNVNTAGQRLTERNLDIQPTITIRPAGRSASSSIPTWCSGPGAGERDGYGQQETRNR